MDSFDSQAFSEGAFSGRSFSDLPVSSSPSFSGDAFTSEAFSDEAFYFSDSASPAFNGESFSTDAFSIDAFDLGIVSPPQGGVGPGGAAYGGIKRLRKFPGRGNMLPVRASGLTRLARISEAKAFFDSDDEEELLFLLDLLDL
jgi:hypothetical protein